MVGREARSRWPVGDGLESCVSVALSGEAERGAGCRGGDGAPAIALCPAVTPVSLCREAGKSRTLTEVLVAQSLSLRGSQIVGSEGLGARRLSFHSG